MSRTTRVPARSTTIGRLQRLLNGWTRSRLVDREPMALRTDLSRHAGWTGAGTR